MMKRSTVLLAISLLPLGLVADDGLEFHEDYYLGFSQGAYYGLMLGGVDYDVAWCMKSELAYEGEAMGTGGEFQAKMETMLAACREKYPPREAE